VGPDWYDRGAIIANVSLTLGAPSMKSARQPDALVEGFDAGLAVGMIALFWQQKLFGLSGQQQSWKLGGVLMAFWPACVPQARTKLCVHLRGCVYFRTCTNVGVGVVVLLPGRGLSLSWVAGRYIGESSVPRLAQFRRSAIVVLLGGEGLTNESSPHGRWGMAVVTHRSPWKSRSSHVWSPC